MFAVFADRIEAAQRLAAALDHYRGKNPLVLAIPRGAVQMGRVVADELGGELDVVLVRKLRAPSSPEFAVGAIDAAPRLEMDLQMPGLRPDRKQRVWLESKEDIKKRTEGKSPDDADALALTFAAPVVAVKRGRKAPKPHGQFAKAITYAIPSGGAVSLV